ncbi:MAG: aldehyde dehydrogenase family protein [Sandaracinaceae bacterium]|nr:aldehyde dehydrogenase family protein [Sandaracinaceae bacterium]
MNPVNENLGPVFADIFQPLADRGFFRLVYGGAAEGDYLCNHPGVEEIHITGSDKTYDAIVWGLGAEGERRKRERTPRNTRRVSSELGNVSPIIVVPGPWSQDDIIYQGVNLASSLTNNAGFNCNATRVVIQHKSWSQRDALNEALSKALDRAARAVLPSAEERHDRFPGGAPRGASVRSRWRGQGALDVHPRRAQRRCGRHLLQHRGVVWRHKRDRARGRLRGGVHRARGGLRQRPPVGHAQLLHHRAPEVARRPRHRQRGGEGHRRPALRLGGGEPLGGARVCVRVHHLGCVPGSPARRHPLGLGRGAQQLPVRQASEERGAWAVHRG